MTLRWDDLRRPFALESGTRFGIQQQYPVVQRPTRILRDLQRVDVDGQLRPLRGPRQRVSPQSQARTRWRCVQAGEFNFALGQFGQVCVICMRDKSAIDQQRQSACLRLEYGIRNSTLATIADLIVEPVSMHAIEATAHAYVRVRTLGVTASRLLQTQGRLRCRTGIGGQQVLFRLGTPQLPEAERGERRDPQSQQQQRQPGGLVPASFQHGKVYTATLRKPVERAMTSKILIVVFLIAIVWNLGAGLYYMMTDKGGSNRTVRSLTWRIGLSVLLIILIAIGMATGYITPHGP